MLASANDTTHVQDREKKEHVKDQPRETASLGRGCCLLHDCTIGIAADGQVRLYVVWCCCAMANSCTCSFWPQGLAPLGGLPLPKASSSNSCFSYHKQKASSASERGTAQLVGKKLFLHSWQLAQLSVKFVYAKALSRSCCTIMHCKNSVFLGGNLHLCRKAWRLRSFPSL